MQVKKKYDTQFSTNLMLKDKIKKIINYKKDKKKNSNQLGLTC
jgi:hypothetical protein